MKSVSSRPAPSHSHDYPGHFYYPHPQPIGHIPWTDAENFFHSYGNSHFPYEKTHQRIKKDKRKYSGHRETPSKTFRLNYSPKYERSKTNSEYSMSTANDELSEFENQNIKTVQKQNFKNKNQLPAIKLRISSAVLEQFENPYNVYKEIQRCKGHKSELKIKFATINRNKVLVIATDDEETHSILSSDWPNDAFIRGVKNISRINFENSNQTKQTTLNPNSKFKIIIKNVHKDIDLDDEFVQSDLLSQGLVKFRRVYTKEQKITTLVKAEAKDHESYSLILRNGIRLGYRSIRDIEPDRPFNQCFNCQAIGHSAFDCEEKQKCAKCSGPHHFRQCQSENTVCANCGESHWALSRSCRMLLESKKQKSNKPAVTHRIYGDVVKSHNKIEEANLTELIQKIVEKVITEKLEQLAVKIMDTYNAALANTLDKLKTHENEPLFQLKECLLNNLIHKNPIEIVAAAKNVENSSTNGQHYYRQTTQSNSNSVSAKASNSNPDSKTVTSNQTQNKYE